AGRDPCGRHLEYGRRQYGGRVRPDAVGGPDPGRGGATARRTHPQRARSGLRGGRGRPPRWGGGDRRLALLWEPTEAGGAGDSQPAADDLVRPDLCRGRWPDGLWAEPAGPAAADR